MTLRISDDEMVSDTCAQTARRLPDGCWVVDGRAGSYDRNQAITAMTIAEVHARGVGGQEPYCRLLRGWEAELEQGGDRP